MAGGAPSATVMCFPPAATRGYDSALCTKALTATLTLSPFAVEELSAFLQLDFLSPELAVKDSPSINQVSSYSKKRDSVSWQQDHKYGQI